ncbi:CDGSH iron-sulfur domain-containing protein [Kribbella antibiotica]|uniref:CDGSH iron-sulfur domain-containing protein n=1 Tax=Kribbella antibiotica TaxID=190195 RepID=A0A4R4YPI1_9ACTN|nr:CDGSH iron-sulfur domain-containing protein [Kribbella antibiotica]TDD46049.1 CDGSH iron-sulfur domain-containing protein [Kribbella antibiotica]
MTTNAEDPATVIRAYPDGPILVRGDFELLDEDGRPVPHDRRTIALCRCGRSAIAPLCDGTHTLLNRRGDSS